MWHSALLGPSPGIQGFLQGGWAWWPGSVWTAGASWSPYECCSLHKEPPAEPGWPQEVGTCCDHPLLLLPLRSCLSGERQHLCRCITESRRMGLSGRPSWCWVGVSGARKLGGGGSVAQSCVTLCHPMDYQASLSFAVSQSLLKLMSIESVRSSNHLVLCHPLLLPSVLVSGPFLMSWLFTTGGQNIEASVSASVLPINIQDWFPLGWTVWISCSPGDSQVFSNTMVQKHQFFGTQPSLWSNSSHPYMTTGKTIALTIWTFLGKVMSLFFNTLSGFVIAFLPGSKHLLISWLQSTSAVILEPPQYKVSHCFHCFPISLPWSDGTGCHDLSFLNVEF